MQRFLIVSVALLLMVTSCEKTSDRVWPEDASDLIVVDGTITNVQKVHHVRLTYATTSPNADPMPVRGVSVIVFDNDSTWKLIESDSLPGVYCSPGYMRPVVGHTYTLLVSGNGKSLTAKATVSKPVDFKPLIVKLDATGMYKIESVANPYNPVRSAMYEVLLDWSFLPAYRGENPADCKAVMFYYTLPTLDVSEVLSPESQVVRFPLGTRITETRYSLSDEHAAFMRALLLNTVWSGGLFNSAPSGLPSNISLGGLGFFGACGVITRSFYVVSDASE